MQRGAGTEARADAQDGRAQTGRTRAALRSPVTALQPRAMALLPGRGPWTPSGKASITPWSRAGSARRGPSGPAWAVDIAVTRLIHRPYTGVIHDTAE